MRPTRYQLRQSPSANSDAVQVPGCNRRDVGTERKMTAVGFEPTPFRTSALSWRLRPLGHAVALTDIDKGNFYCTIVNNNFINRKNDTDRVRTCAGRAHRSSSPTP